MRLNIVALMKRKHWDETLSNVGAMSQALRPSFCKDRVCVPFVNAVQHVFYRVLLLDKRNLEMAFHYVWSEIRRNNFSFFIGLFTVFTTVSVVGFLPAVYEKSPWVFLKLAEVQVGEADMVKKKKNKQQ
ncbi:hypothetical protein RFI_10312 [Reticulomyxa filosa]|uniref:Uncharacterized protein n=1 Tax=Reticulomyxa filosa TaxID=46433 RepID=X6NLF7_RETFI|nr:hypothetical protein RFI_10312 [Reticulomyxa filosa]|eukprot:ETO26821.1 hypothetical protein RFI_10312 [Reticulomyxa filosa]